MPIPTCPSVHFALTYNPYPGCGPATCISGYVVSAGACIPGTCPNTCSQGQTQAAYPDCTCSTPTCPNTCSQGQTQAAYPDCTCSGGGGGGGCSSPYLYQCCDLSVNDPCLPLLSSQSDGTCCNRYNTVCTPQFNSQGGHIKVVGYCCPKAQSCNGLCCPDGSTCGANNTCVTASPTPTPSSTPTPSITQPLPQHHHMSHYQISIRQLLLVQIQHVLQIKP